MMTINEALDKAFENQVGILFGIYVDSVASAHDKESELAAAAERFKKGLAILNEVLTRAKEVSVNIV
jgi:hypothetical protein